MSDFILTQIMVYSLLKRVYTNIILILCLSLPSVGLTAVVDGLFNSSVEVASQQGRDRDAAFNQALVKTLLKVSGVRELVTDPAIQQQFFPAERYVQSFSYQENPRYTAYLAYQKKLEELSALDHAATPSSELAFSQFDPIPYPHILSVEFAPKALEAKMRQLNMPIWGNVRAQIMFWVLVESDGERVLLGTSEESDLRDQLSERSKDYALPIAFPLADKIDIQNINSSDLWGLFPDALDKVKQRYPANGDLMARVYQSSETTWSANWHFAINDVVNTGFLHNASLADINDEIFSFISAILAKRFSVTASDASVDQAISLEVSNINSFQDYADAQVFLESVSPLKSFSLKWVEGDKMLFLIELNGSVDQLKEYLKLSGKLQFMSSELVSQPINESLAADISQEMSTQLTPEQNSKSTLGADIVANSLVQLEKYKWLSSTSKTNKK